MCVLFIRNVIMCLLAYRVTYIDNLSIKRSPLELGYVTFPYETEGHKRFFNHNKAKVKVDVKDVTDLSVSRTNGLSHTHEWVPGQIRHHSFIPAHIHHVYVPVILARSVIVKPLENYYYDFYPKTTGGYGVGSSSGGQGSGHGFQIIFNGL